MANGLWSEYTLPADIVVIPSFYQTTWFMVICAVAVLATLAVGHRLQIQYVTARMRDRLEERAAERVRIARDLHDTLLQGLQGLMLRFHFAAEQIPDNQPAQLMMREALEVADRVVEEGRDRVRTLRAELSGRDLSRALAEAGEELNWSSACSLASPPKVRTASFVLKWRVSYTSSAVRLLRMPFVTQAPHVSKWNSPLMVKRSCSVAATMVRESIPRR